MPTTLTTLLSPFLLGIICAQRGAIPQAWTAVLQLLFLVAIVIVPIAAQAAVSVWWVRKRLKSSGQHDSQTFGWVLSHALVAWLFFSLFEFAALFALVGIANGEGHPFGYIGFALLGLVLLYVGLGLVIGVLAAAAMWRAQQRKV